MSPEKLLRAYNKSRIKASNPYKYVHPNIHKLEAFVLMRRFMRQGQYFESKILKALKHHHDSTTEDL